MLRGRLDKLWWRPGWTTENCEVFDEKLAVELNKPVWIMDGNYCRTLPKRLQYAADTVIFLQYSRWTCLAGVLSRFFRMHGMVRVDMTAGCPERMDWTFLHYVWTFNTQQGPKVEAALYAFPGQIIRLRSRREAERFLTGNEVINAKSGQGPSR